MSRIRVEVDGDVVFDRAVDEHEGMVSNGHLTMTADWKPEPQPYIDAPTKAVLDDALRQVVTINPEVLKP